MKKWLIGLTALVILSVAGIYIFIPKKLVIAKTNLVKANHNSLIRFFSYKTNWQKFLQGDNLDTSNRLVIGGTTFSVNKVLLNGLEIKIQSSYTETASTLTFFSIGKDSSAMEWKCEMNSGDNLLNRINTYRKAISVKKNMTEILNKLHAFVENENNVYQLDIKHEIIADTMVIAQKADFKTYPSVTQMYTMINRLRKYATDNGAIVTGHPMMNVTVTIESIYKTMVAVPVNKKIKNSSSIELKNLTSGTPSLTTIVHGGNYNAAKALNILENYKIDHQFVSPAIPYYILLTDRDKQPDTTKWETKPLVLLFPWFK